MSASQCSPLQCSPLKDAHVAAGGKLVDFAGWQLPVHYGSQMEEHRAVREQAGVFDISHMTIVDLHGSGVRDWLRTLLANDVGKLADGEAQYGCLCNERGGVVDDVIAYRHDSDHWRLIVNAATREKDIAWLAGHCPVGVELQTPEAMAMLAVQGPDGVALAMQALRETREFVPELSALERFSFAGANDLFVARTGYTGEDGVELALPASEVMALWEALVASGARPCGLGARDTLRLEAGMSLYGNDLDEEHSPVECGLSWTVDLADDNRDFIGRAVVALHKTQGGRCVRIGLVREERGVLRAGQPVVLDGRQVGVLTSGTFSPTLQHSIALARVEAAIDGGCDVLVRDRPLSVQRAAIPFVRRGTVNA